jgi:hypothetical protein
MAKILLNLPLEAIDNFQMADFYSDFWKLADETNPSAKFAKEEKIISNQLLEQAWQENNPIRKQYLVLALILFGELIAVQDLIDEKFWSQQLKEDYKRFAVSKKFANTFLSHDERGKLGKTAENRATLASLYKRYFGLINKHSLVNFNEEDCPQVSSENYQIYFCWLQGEENLPPIVRCCYNSLQQNSGHYRIIFIDEKNFSNYVDISPHIMDKFRADKISRTHFSDILRINLLEQHGGLWLDSTMLVTEPLNRYKNILEKPFFTQRFHKEKTFQNWCIYPFGLWATFTQGTNIIHNPLYVFIKEFFFEYLRTHDSFEVYFLQDFAISLAYENIPFVRQEIDDVPINNTSVHSLRKLFNSPCEEIPFDKLFPGNFLHKLTYKIKLDITQEDTVLRKIQKRYAPETIT